MKRKMMCGVLIVLLHAGFFAGCGGGDNGGGGGGTGTVDDAKAVGQAVVVADIGGLGAIMAGALSMTTKMVFGTGKAGVTDVNVVPTTLACNEGTFSEATGTIGTATINGADFGAGGSGSCLAKADGTVSATVADIDETLNCTAFNSGGDASNVTMTGLLGLFSVMTFSGTSANITMFNMGTKGLTGTVNGKNCDMVLALDGSATLDTTTGAGVLTIDGGCVSVCDSNFTVTGTVDF